MSQCKKFAPNIFHKTKCSNCFRQKEEHSAEALECNRASRSIARSGYLFVAPDWDFSVPLNRTKRWQRRWFVLYDDGELNYSVDEHPDTVPQGSVDMSKVLEVTGAEQITGHPHSLALTGPDRVTFVKAASREDARWWAELLAVFPRRHKRNATFPGGRASPSLPQLGRSASPQPPRPRHLSYIGPSTRTTFANTFREEKHVENKSLVAPEISTGWTIAKAPPKTDYLVTSGSPPTHDKIRPEDTVVSSRDWRKARLRDIASALTDQSSDTTVALPAEGVLNLKKGWLWYKEKNTDNEWVRRWWVLCEQTLNSYIDQDDQSIPEITIELPTINSVTEVSTDVRYGFQINWSGPTYILSAVTSNIRCNWLQMLKKAVSTVDSPPAPATPRSCLFSSDEEYRTASEGGRRDSEDWGEIPSSPPLPKNTFAKVKDRSRLKTKLPRNQSRQSTLDSVSTDEIDACRPPDEMEMKNSVNKQTLEIDALKQQLSCALTEMQNLETQLSRVEAGEEKLPLYLGTEYLNQVENLRSAYRRSLGDCDSRKQQTDLERLQVLCEQVLVAMEQWHRKTLQELREQHTRELQALHQDKEQALAEETQATLAALDAMRKAHEAEVQREVARFKQDFARQQQDELLDLTERLSVKCLEAAALEEQLGSATRQLAHAQQHILQLERNPQLSLQN